MALDKTDQRLVNGLIISVVLFAVLYFWPEGWIFDGLSAMQAKEVAARNALEVKGTEYARHFTPMQPVHFGRNGDPIVSVDDSAPIKGLKTLYEDANQYTVEQVNFKQAANRIVFPTWTDIADTEIDGGVYFRKIWDMHKKIVEQACAKANVELDDADLGLSRIPGGVPDKAKALEFLRELYIAEKIIDLAIQAKLAEEKREKDLGKQPEAFMRIMMVEPRDSDPTGPTALIPNPNYNPAEKNPASPKFRKFNIESWRIFIQEYPVKIRFICDTNTFIHFLHSVRTPRDSKFEFTGVTPINGTSYPENTQRIPELRNRDTKEKVSIRPEEQGKRISFADGSSYTVTKVEPLGIWLKPDNGQEFIVLEGQFLVFRQLEILSPSFDQSKADKAEIRDFKGDAADITVKRKWPDKPEQILVTITAAGMDFFDPVKFPFGLHPKKKAEIVKPRAGGRQLGNAPGGRPARPTPPPPEDKDKDK